MAELLKKMHDMQISFNKDMSLVTSAFDSMKIDFGDVKSELALVVKTLKEMASRYNDEEAKEVVRHLKIVKD
jgi:hypothetical protein